jgi:hypothetical protein
MKEQIVKREDHLMTWWEKGIIDGLIGLCLGLVWMVLVAFARKFLFPDLSVEWVLASGLVVFWVTGVGLAVLQHWGWGSLEGRE